MSTIKTQIALMDNFSQPMAQITAAAQGGADAMKALQATMNQESNPEALNAAKASMEKILGLTKDVQGEAGKATQAQKKYNEEVDKGAAFMEQLKGAAVRLAGAYVGMQGIRKVIDFSKESIAADNVQIEAETKLGTVMRQRMGANDDMVDSVKSLASAQQNLGVIGDEVQMFGAQQLATFLTSDKALKTLIPAMDNLAAQQNGVNVTTESMVNLGNLMGKVMQGQTSALTRVGITFSAAQEQVLKYGTEEEKAATLAQVITDNVGNMNAVLAETPEGKAQQFKNAWGDVTEVFGQELYPAVMTFYDTMNSHMPQIEAVTLGFGKSLAVIVGIFGKVASAAADAGSFIVNHWDVIGPVIIGAAGAMLTYRSAIVAATAAQAVYNAVQAADPTMLKVAKIGILIGSMIALADHIARVTGVAQTGFGVITGGINVVITWVKNAGETVAGVFTNTQGAADAVAHNVEAAFHNALMNVESFFFKLLSAATTAISGIASSLNALPFVNIDTAGLQSAANHYAALAQSKIDNKWSYESVPMAFKSGWASDAFKRGVSWGDGVADKVKGMFGALSGAGSQFSRTDYSGIGDGVGKGLQDSGVADAAKQTAKNTDGLSKTADDLSFLRDVAEREVIDRTVFSRIELNVGGINNTVNNSSDLDSIGAYLVRTIQEQMASGMEGVGVSG